MTCQTARISEVILLVEDDDIIRRLTRSLLEREGYVVIEARDGNEGLSCYEAHLKAISLLLTDVSMPKLGGRELAEGAWKLQPALKVLFMSGYLNDVVLEERVRNGAPFLEKPFTAKGLIDKVRQALQIAA
jgi:CheY-like chemotaxis protein